MFRSDQLGPALRTLRSRRQLKQLQVAARAGITSSMLSGYENGRKTPTLASLEKILLAMDFSLADLLDALQSPEAGESETAGRPPALGGETVPYVPGLERGGSAWEFDLEEILGAPPLAREEAVAFGEMLSGYCRWLRYLRRQRGPAPPNAEDP